jgi:hypothetical protein
LKREGRNEEAKQRYGWLLGYEEDLGRWLEQYDVVEKASKQGRVDSADAGPGALLGKHDEAEVRQALAAVPQKKAEGTLARPLGPSFRWLRQQLFGAKDM